MKMRESMRITIFYRFSFEAMLKVKDNIKFASKNAEMRDYWIRNDEVFLNNCTSVIISLFKK